MWKVNNLTDWEEPEGLHCFFTEHFQCKTDITLIIYKRPDWVKMKSTSSVWVEGVQTELQCEIENVGPGRVLSVRWSRADPKQNTFSRLTETSFPDLLHETKTVSRTVNRIITPRREDDRAQYRCEAQLNLNQTLVFTSNPINITVHHEKQNFYWLLFLITVPVVVVGFFCYRRKRMGHYIPKQLRGNHVTHNTATHQQQILHSL